MKCHKKPRNNIIFIIFVIMNVIMITIGVYTLYFTPYFSYVGLKTSRDVYFCFGAFKNFLLFSGIWMLIDVIFLIYFSITKEL